MVSRTAPAPHETTPRAPRTALPRPDSKQATTPLMKQYLEIKEAHPREVLFFRMGDFYEMFFEDAELVSRVLGITQTTRASGSAGAYAMAGFPYHALDRYLPRMIKAGYRVAICEQVEDPALVKGKRVVKRAVIEVVTPGTLTDERLLDERKANYLLGIHVDRRRRKVGLAWFEASSGRFQVGETPLDSLDAELERIGPAEIVIADKVLGVADRGAERAGSDEEPWEFGFVARLSRVAPVSGVADWAFRPAAALEALCEGFAVKTLKGMGLSDEATYVPAAHAVINYVSDMKPGYLDNLDRFGRGIELYHHEEHLALDPATARCLEITRPLRDSGGGQEATLFGALDRTQTAMGGRLLREWLLAPLCGVEAIERRQEAVEALLAAPGAHQSLSAALRQVYDLERLAARAASKRVGPRDLAALRDSLARLPEVGEAARGAVAAIPAKESEEDFFAEQAPLLCEIADRLAPLAPLQELLGLALEDRPAATIREGRVLRTGRSPELDRLRSVTEDAGTALREFQEREVELTGIPSLKVGYNKVFGYYLEVTQAHKNKVPERYIRKQTLKTCERFLTPELKELETEILSARERADELEGALLAELKDEVAQAGAAILTSAAAAAELDVLSGLATLAREGDYVRPALRKDTRIKIIQGRHPVLDVGEARARFVPNDLEMGPDTGRMHLITGPNMAGKSTYIRQAALLVLMAQTGSFVPAVSAEIGVCDRIFARVGAGDELAQGLSTFMVEMTETANILRHATKRSLVILDEVGRGTSTYDGVSLAWAIAEHLHDVVEARTLFATHYHELTGMAALRAGVRNRNVAVEERGNEITFLHQIVPGSASRSYGIHVARLAGVPPVVLRRAHTILGQLEEGTFDPGAPPQAPRDPERQLGLFNSVSEDPLRARLRELSLDETTPMDALLLLQELQGLLE